MTMYEKKSEMKEKAIVLTNSSSSTSSNMPQGKRKEFQKKR